MVPPHTLRDQVKGRLGKYALEHRVGSGSMGEVFVAHDTTPGASKTPIALKRILPGLSDRPDIRQLFVDEARLTTRMQHRNLVPAIDAECADELGFFTMPYVDGIGLTPLLQACARGSQRMPLGGALAIVQGIARGLHHAHQLCHDSGSPLEVTHCDVAPANALVTTQGEVKLVDWGIARGHHTRRGLPETARGTLGYSSPEQSRGGSVDRRSDVFSLGVLLWELTTMRRLFRGVNRADTALRVANADAPRPCTVLPGYPEELETIVMRALARDRDQRFGSATALELSLERFVRRHRVDTSPHVLATWVRTLLAG